MSISKDQITDSMRRCMVREPEPPTQFCSECGGYHPLGRHLGPQSRAWIAQEAKIAAESAAKKAQEAPETGLEAPQGHKTGHNSGGGVSFTIWGVPVPKPRQTRSDQWKKRPCVVRYREWADKAREAANGCCTADIMSLWITVYIPIPKSYSAKKRAELAGQPHRGRGDGDNYLKSAGDALFPQDCGLWYMEVRKLWDDGKGPRMEVTVQ